MKNKNIYIFLLMFLVCILSISVISATSEITSNKQITSTDNNVENNIETNICYDDVSISNMNDELILEENNGRDEESGYRTDKTTESNDDPLTFTELNKTINDNTNSTIYLSQNYKYNNASDTNFKNGIPISRNLTIYGNQVTIDGSKMARIFNVVDSNLNVKFYNINFINGKTLQYGGAIYGGNATNCTFTQNYAKNGGAISNGNAYNCTFTENHAYNPFNSGGAIYQGNAYNCIFTQNYAEVGGAIYKGNAYNCNFINNTAYYGGVICYGNATNCTFNGQTKSVICDGNATNCTFNGLTSSAIQRGNAYYCNFINNTAEVGGAISNGNAYNCIFTNNKATSSDKGGGAIYGGNAYDCIFTDNEAERFGGAIYGGNATNCTFTRNNAEQSGAIAYGNAYNCIFIENYAKGAGRAVGGNATSCTFIDNYCQPSYVVWGKCTNCTFKYYSKITASPVTITYNVDKYLIITLKDLKKRSIPHAGITVNLGSTKRYTTDAEGQVKVNIANLIPKTYNVKITYAESANKNPTTSIKITVKKATPKITAKSARFKLKVKTKKYAAIFKNNKNQALKNTKVTLKVNGKTYSVKTNTKGIGVFKITKLKKIGSYTAVITVPTNKYYNKVTKKVKITVKK